MTQFEQERVERAVRGMQFAKPGEVEPGTEILFDMSRGSAESWVKGVVGEPSDGESHHLNVYCKGQLWVMHRTHTRLLEPKFVGALGRVREVLRNASGNQEYVRVRLDDLRELEKLIVEPTKR